MSVNPRISGFWSVASRSSDMNYYGDEEEDVGLVQGSDQEECDGRTPLDRTIDRIGMGTFTCTICSRIVFCSLSFTLRSGSYQWTLLSLCGFGESHTRNDGALTERNLNSLWRLVGGQCE